MKPRKLPTYGHHKPTGQARIYVNGKSVYLGKFGSEEIRYGEIVGKLLSGQPIDPFASQQDPKAEAGLTVNELTLAYLRHAEVHYVKNGKQTSEIHCLKATIRPLVDLFGFTPVNEFGPMMLKTVRAKMVDSGWVRNSCNHGVKRIRRIFKWGVENELVHPTTLQKLQAVAPLLAGRTEAKDNPPREAVDSGSIEAVRSLVRPMVRDLIDLQRLTGARSGELLQLTTGGINRTGDVWTAELSDHKTRHHGQRRILHFGPKSQSILTRYLSAAPNATLFKITRSAYCRAITRACDKAKITRWVPHQLRHTAADTVRQSFGLEHTQSVLGHSKADMTEHYAKAGQAKAAEVARSIG